MTEAPENGASADEPTGRLVVGGRPARWDTCGKGIVRNGSSNAKAIEDCPTQVQLRLAPNAVVCGSLGCREVEPLLSVTVETESRVLCSDCATKFVEQVGGDE